MTFDGEIFSPRKDLVHYFRHLASGLLRYESQRSRSPGVKKPRRAPFLKLFNVRTSLFCCFEKRLTLNLEEKADRLKIFIRTNYVLAIKFG